MLRRVVPSGFGASLDPSMNLISSVKSDMHFVTSWQVEISVEQRDTRKAVSSFVDAVTRCGRSSSRSDNSFGRMLVQSPQSN